jgi:hypothetical protein
MLEIRAAAGKEWVRLRDAIWPCLENFDDRGMGNPAMLAIDAHAQAIAGRGPGNEERAPPTVAKSKAARHNALDAGFGFFAKPDGKHRGRTTFCSTAAWLQALFPLWPYHAPLFYPLLDWRHSRTARPENGEPPRDARIGGSEYRHHNRGG